MNKFITLAFLFISFVFPTDSFAKQTWTLADMQEGNDNYVLNFYALDETHIWGLGVVKQGSNSQFVGIRSTDGNSFSQMSLPSSGGSQGITTFFSIAFVDENIGFIVGTEITLPFKGFGDDMANNKIWKTTNGGSSWNVFAENLETPISKLYVSPTGEVFGISDSTVYKLTESSAPSVEISGLGDRSIHSIQMFDTNTGFLAGGIPEDSENNQVAGEGFIMKTTDGGATWTMIKENLPFNITNISFINETRGWIASYDANKGYIQFTDDGGATFQNQTLPEHPSISIDFGSLGGTQTVGPAYPESIYGLKFFDCTRGVALASTCISDCDGGEDSQPSFLNFVLRTYDAGNTWEFDTDFESAMQGGQFMPEAKVLSALITIAFPTPNTGFIGGQHFIILKYSAASPEELPSDGIPSCTNDDNNDDNNNNNNNDDNTDDNNSSSSDSGCGCKTNSNTPSSEVLFFGIFVLISLIARKKIFG